MARHKSPFTDWVYEAWDELVLLKGDKIPLDERKRRAKELYDKVYVDGQWTVPFDDALLVATLASSLEMVSSNFPLARDFLRPLFEHKGFVWPSKDWVTVDIYVREAVADILSGNVEAGVSKLRAGLHVTERSRHFRHSMAGDLLGLFDALGLQTKPDSSIVKLTSELIADSRGKKRLAAAVLEATSYRELWDALGSLFFTSPRNPPPAANAD